MKLLMITRKVDKDDAQAGFIYGWVKKLGEKVNQLKVICLEKGNTEGLPKNIEVFSLGKENGKNRIKEFINFQKGALKFVKQVDGVFCHMNPEYTILISPYAKIFRKKVVVWYSHKAINWKVRLINILADKIVTPTKDGFGLKSNKKIVIGHGIDTELFKPAQNKEKNDIFRIISVGRISPIKDYKTLIKAIDIVNKNINIKVDIVGGLGLDSQQNYFKELQSIIKEKKLENVISFKNLIPNKELPKYYQDSDLSINLCPTGSPDKAVLESMACNLPVLVANETFKKDFGLCAEQLIFKHSDSEDLAQKIIDLTENSQLEGIGKHLREEVVRNHNLDNLMNKLIYVFKENY